MTLSVDKGEAVDISSLHFFKAFDFTVTYNISLDWKRLIQWIDSWVDKELVELSHLEGSD